MSRIPTPSSIKLGLAKAQAQVDTMKEKNAAIRAQMGLTGRQLFKLKPLSEKFKTAIANSKYGRK